MRELLVALNRLLPFATPGTPLLQDLIHLAALCGIFYFAPLLSQHSRQQEIHAESDANVDLDENGDNAFDIPGGDIGDQATRNVQAAHDAFEEAGQEPDADREAEIEAGPAGEDAQAQGHATPRDVGAKKAKSLARRDQRRAYHEFQRSLGDAQRAQDAEGAAEREAALEKERERRRAAEEALEAKKAKARQEKRSRDKRDWEEEMQRREGALAIVKDALERQGTCDSFRVARQVGQDDVWMEKLLNGSNILGKAGDSLTLLMASGWVARVSADSMASVYQTFMEKNRDNRDHADLNELGDILQKILLSRDHR